MAPLTSVDRANTLNLILFIVVATCNNLLKLMKSTFQSPCRKSSARYPHFYATHPFDQKVCRTFEQRPHIASEDISEAIFELYGLSLLCESSFKVSLLVKK